MPVDSLVEMATRACGRTSKLITDIGDMPYDLIRPVLLKIENPEQLHQLEVNSPQIIGRDAEIWLTLIKRDIPDWETKPHEPKDPKNWWKVYRKLKEESQNAMALGEDKLKAALNNIQNTREQNLAQLRPRKDLPRAEPSRRHRIVHGYNSGRTGSVGAHKLSLLDKVKKEARDARAARFAVPSRDPLKKNTTRITRPPQQFVEDLRREKALTMQRQQLANERPIRVPRPPMHASQSKRVEVPSSQGLEDREARLRALTSGSAAPRTNHHAPIISVEGPTTPVSRRQLSFSMAEPADPFSSRSSGSKVATSMLSASALEGSVTKPRQLLADALAKPRARSPGRLASPQPRTLKRREPPSLFMSTPKKIAKPSEIT